MPKPVKIKKAKSFMFTTKHHSFAGWLGVVVCAISITVLVSSVYLSFINKGVSSVAIGGMGLSSLLLDFVGLISGVTSLNERDIHRWVPITAIVANIVMIVLWVAIVMHGR